MAKEIIDYIYDRVVIRHAEDRKRTNIVSDENYVGDENPLFGRINGAP